MMQKFSDIMILPDRLLALQSSFNCISCTPNEPRMMTISLCKKNMIANAKIHGDFNKH